MTTVQQPLLFRSTPEDQNVRKLIQLLLEAGDWLTREQISDRTGWKERRIRQYAAAARDDKGDPIVIRWQRGFCHRDFVPIEEINRAYAQTIHQSDEQRREAIGLRRVAFRKLKGWLK